MPWSSIGFSHHQRAEEKLSRSKSVPLSIKYRHDEMKGIIDGSHEVLLTQALNRLPLIRTAPLIEYLHLLGPTHGDVDTTLQSGFPNGIAPRLKHAMFIGFGIDLSVLLIHGVEILVLGPRKQPASIPNTLVLLSNLPKVVELRIAFAFCRPDDLDVSRLASMDSVVMPDCRFLQVIGAEMASQEALASSTMFLQ